MRHALSLTLVCFIASLTQATGVSTDFAARLEDLNPDQSEAYFDLGEEIAEVARSEEDRMLAIRLFVLADHHNPVMFRRSSILAIMPLIDDATVHRLLSANLRAATVRTSLMPGGNHLSPRDSDAIMGAVDALSALRKGDSKEFQRLLEIDGVAEVISAHSESLPGDIRWMQRRLGKRGSRESTLEFDDQISTLELQAELLGSSDQPWSVVLHIERGRPVTVVEPIPLSEIFGISTSQDRWIDGRWVE